MTDLRTSTLGSFSLTSPPFPSSGPFQVSVHFDLFRAACAHYVPIHRTGETAVGDEPSDSEDGDVSWRTKALHWLLPWKAAGVASLAVVLLASWPEIRTGGEATYSAPTAVAAASAIALIWYAAVTWSSVAQSRQLHLSDRKRKIIALAKTAERLVDAVQELPDGGDPVSDFQEGGGLGAAHVEKILDYSREADETIEPASDAARHLNWLTTYLSSIQNPQAEVSPDIRHHQLRHEEWDRRKSAAEDSLRKVAGKAYRAAAEILDQKIETPGGL